MARTIPVPMTWREVVAYLGYMSDPDILAYIEDGELPRPAEGDLRDPTTATWDREALDRALDQAARE